MEFARGDIIRNPMKPEWGIGKVLDAPAGHTLRVFFVTAGEKTLALDVVKPERVDGAAVHPALAAAATDGARNVQHFRNIPAAIEGFLARYPRGFHGERYAAGERCGRLRSHVLAADLFSRDACAGLIATGRFQSFQDRAHKLLVSTNLLYADEKAALLDGLASDLSREAFAKALHGLLWGDGSTAERFVAYAHVLDHIGAARWTIATCLPFLVQPVEMIFVRPEVVKKAALACRASIAYRTALCWATYASLLKFARQLRGALAPLKPRDMIDVYAFMEHLAEQGAMDDGN
jgi:hypothetical protein